MSVRLVRVKPKVVLFMYAREKVLKNVGFTSDSPEVIPFSGYQVLLSGGLVGMRVGP